MFPQRLDSPLAYDIAKAMMDGFNRHYQLFRTESARAKHRFETADWHGQQRAQRERIEFYDLRVREASMRLEREFKAGEQPMEVWHQIKLHYIGLLVDHHQPELAETFFNSVTTKILHRSYFHNDFIFVRPAVSTEYIENGEPAAQPTYRAYYPTRDTLQAHLVKLVNDFELHIEFEDLLRDAGYVVEEFSARLGEVKLRANFQMQVLSGLFFRNKGAYIVGKLINGFSELPFALPLLHGKSGKLLIDSVLIGEDDLLILFSFARAYFMVDMGIPSAYVQFLRSMMPRKPRNEIYNALGLAKQGKTLFYRDFLHHQRHSTDKFRIAPGIKGMVMLVFDLPSFPYVFKVIKDYYPPQKDTTREQIKGHSRAFTTANAQRGDTFLEAARPQGIHQRHHDARTAGTNRMAQCTSAAVHIHDVMADFQLMHQRQRNHGKRLVYLPQINVRHRPARFGQHFVNGTDGCGGEPVGFLRVHGVGDDFCHRLATQFRSGGGPHQHQGGSTVVDAGAAGRGDGAVFLERRFERGDFVQLDLAGAFIDRDDDIARAALHGHRSDLWRKGTRLGGRLRALHAGGGKCVLLGTCEAVFGRAVFAKGAHGAACFVGIFQAIEHHVIHHPVMPNANAAAALEQQVRRVGHALHAARHHHVVAAGQQHVMRKHSCLHARPTHFGQRDRPRADR